MEDLSYHLTDTNHNWIVPTCDTNSTNLTNLVVQNGILNLPDGYNGSNFIQANYNLPVGSAWYIEADIKISTGGTTDEGISLICKETSDGTFYGPELEIRIWDSNYRDIYFHSHDAVGENKEDWANLSPDDTLEYTYRLEVDSNTRTFAVFGYSSSTTDVTDRYEPKYVYKYIGSNPLYPNTLVRPMLNFNTGYSGSIYEVSRVRIGKVTTGTLIRLYDCLTWGEGELKFLDLYNGSENLTSHIPDLGDYYYTSSASAIVTNGYVKPCIFQAYPNSAVYIRAGIVALQLNASERVSIKIHSSSNWYINIEVEWGAGDICNLEIKTPSSGTYTDTFSLGAYGGDTAVPLLFDTPVPWTWKLTLGDWANIIATVVDLSETTSSFNLHVSEIEVFSNGNNSYIEYIRMCDLLGG